MAVCFCQGPGSVTQCLIFWIIISLSSFIISSLSICSCVMCSCLSCYPVYLCQPVSYVNPFCFASSLSRQVYYVHLCLPPVVHFLTLCVCVYIVCAFLCALSDCPFVIPDASSAYLCSSSRAYPLLFIIHCCTSCVSLGFRFL